MTIPITLWTLPMPFCIGFFLWHMRRSQKELGWRFDLSALLWLLAGVVIAALPVVNWFMLYICMQEPLLERLADAMSEDTTDDH